MKKKSRRPARKAAKSKRKSIMRHSREGVGARRRKGASKTKSASSTAGSRGSRKKAASGQVRVKAKAGAKKRSARAPAGARSATRRPKAKGAPRTRTKRTSRPPAKKAAKKMERGARPDSASSRGEGFRIPSRSAVRRGLPGGSASRRRRSVDGEDRSLSAPIDARGIGSEAGGQSGDTEGLSRAEQADSESVEELVEEGQAFEAGVVDGVENAPDADRGPVRTREVPEDDVPEEYLEDDRPGRG